MIIAARETSPQIESYVILLCEKGCIAFGVYICASESQWSLTQVFIISLANLLLPLIVGP